MPYKSPKQIINEITEEKKRKLLLFNIIVESILKEGVDDDPFLSMFKKQAKAIGTLAGETAQAGTHALSALGKLAFTVKAIINDEPPEYLKQNLSKVNAIRNNFEDFIKKYTPESEVSPIGHLLVNAYLGGLPVFAQLSTKAAEKLDEELLNEKNFLQRIKESFKNNDNNYGINGALEGFKDLISDYEAYCEGYPKKTDSGKSSISSFVQSKSDVIKKIDKNKDEIFDSYFKSNNFLIEIGKDEFLSKIFFNGNEISKQISSYLLDIIFDSINNKKGSAIKQITKADRTNTGLTGSLKIVFNDTPNDASKLANLITKHIIEEKRKDGLELFELLKIEINKIKSGLLNFDKSDIIKNIDANHNVYEKFYERLKQIHEDQKKIRQTFEKNFKPEKKAILDYLTQDLKKKAGTILSQVKNKASSYKNGNKDKLCAAVEDIKNIIDKQKS